jgi:hypothetical protein
LVRSAKITGVREFVFKIGSCEGEEASVEVAEESIEFVDVGEFCFFFGGEAVGSVFGEEGFWVGVVAEAVAGDF